MPARLLEKYRSDVVPALKKEFGITNRMAVPRIEKVVLNMGIGDAIQNAKLVDAAAEELTKIAG
jgi:large subunit ribosomal protein L5